MYITPAEDIRHTPQPLGMSEKNQKQGKSQNHCNLQQFILQLQGSIYVKNRSSLICLTASRQALTR